MELQQQEVHVKYPKEKIANEIFKMVKTNIYYVLFFYCTQILTSSDFHAWFFVYCASTRCGLFRLKRIKLSLSELVLDPRKKAVSFLRSQGVSKLALFKEIRCWSHLPSPRG